MYVILSVWAYVCGCTCMIVHVSMQCKYVHLRVLVYGYGCLLLSCFYVYWLCMYVFLCVHTCAPCVFQCVSSFVLVHYQLMQEAVEQSGSQDVNAGWSKAWEKQVTPWDAGDSRSLSLSLSLVPMIYKIVTLAMALTIILTSRSLLSAGGVVVNASRYLLVSPCT